MTTDIDTVMWKEWKELLESQFSPRGGLVTRQGRALTSFPPERACR